MKHTVFFIILCIAVAMQSCTSELDPLLESGVTNTEISRIMVKIEGKVYESDVVTTGDSVAYLNEEYAEIYRSKISTNPDIAAMVSVNEEGVTCVEYFQSESELLSKYNFIQLIDSSEVKESRSKVIDLMPPNSISKILGVAVLYDDRNFKDTELIAYATTTWVTSVPRLTELGFNDKTSSIKVYNKMEPYTEYIVQYTDVTQEYPNIKYKPYMGHSLRPVLKCFHNSNYSGTAIYCIAPPSGHPDVHMDYNLKTIGWNDRISAIYWILVYDFSNFEGEDPLMPPHDEC